MSIILDALRKSESERLREAEAHRSELPRARGRTRMPWWVWAVAVLLLANVALLLWLVSHRAGVASSPEVARVRSHLVLLLLAEQMLGQFVYAHECRRRRCRRVLGRRRRD